MFIFRKFSCSDRYFHVLSSRAVRKYNLSNNFTEENILLILKSISSTRVPEKYAKENSQPREHVCLPFTANHSSLPREKYLQEKPRFFRTSAKNLFSHPPPPPPSSLLLSPLHSSQTTQRRCPGDLSFSPLIIIFR